MLCLSSYLFFGLQSGYSSHEHTYVWTATAAFKTGVAPAAVFAVLWTCLALGSVVAVRHIKYHDKIAETIILPSDQAWLHRSRWHVLTLTARLRALMLILFIINLIFVFTINALYVFSQQSDEQSVAFKLTITVLLVLVKSLWTYFPVRLCCKAIQNYSLYLGMMVFNNLVMPCIVVAVTDSSCFYNFFFPSSINEVTSSYQYKFCAQIFRLLPDGYEMCTEYVERSMSQHFRPAFVYNFQCGSTIIVQYTGVFIFGYLLMVALDPLKMCLANLINPRCIPTYLARMLPGIYFPQLEGSQFNSLFNPYWEVHKNVFHIFMLLTFGSVNPILAACIALAGLISSLLVQSRVLSYVLYQSADDAVFSLKSSTTRTPSIDRATEMVVQPASISSDPHPETPVSASPLHLHVQEVDRADSYEQSAVECRIIDMDAACFLDTSKLALLPAGVMPLLTATFFYAVLLFDMIADQQSSPHWISLLVSVFSSNLALVLIYYVVDRSRKIYRSTLSQEIEDPGAP